MTTPQTSPWMKVPEGATYSKRSKSTIIKALQDGSLRGSQAVKGGTWLIHIDDLDAWIRGEIAPAEPVARIARRTQVAS